MGRHIELRQFELPFPEDFSSVSLMIKEHNSSHPGEMLPKTPEELMMIYQEGLSIVLKQDEKVLSHAALWPLLKGADGRLLVAEFGSWIVNPNFRHHRINDDLTVGEYTAKALLEETSDIGVIATVKRANSFQGLIRIGFQPLNFYEFPWIASLTCVCSGKAENLTQLICSDRRRIDYGLDSKGNLDLGFLLNPNSINDPRKIPCTLLGYNFELLEATEQKLQNRSGLPGVADFQQPDFFVHFLPQARQFFDQKDYQLV